MLSRYRFISKIYTDIYVPTPSFTILVLFFFSFVLFSEIRQRRNTSSEMRPPGRLDTRFSSRCGPYRCRYQHFRGHSRLSVTIRLLFLNYELLLPVRLESTCHPLLSYLPVLEPNISLCDDFVHKKTRRRVFTDTNALSMK